MKEPARSYTDILTLPHYEPRHPRMPRQTRAAQFAPFDALNGYSAAIQETAKEHAADRNRFDTAHAVVIS